MGAIYSNAYCNFSATLAAELPVGLFFDRNLTHSKAFPVTIERQGHHFECFGFSVKALTHLNDESLMQRGWVLQERLLSPRTIYFGHQLSWECGQSLANELFPKGVPGGFGNYWGSNTPYKLSRLLNTDPTLATNPAFVSNTDDTEPSKSILYERWSEIVLTYSACELSFDTDILPAISGLAQQFGELLGDVYLAGLWQSTLLRDLLWSRSSAWKASDLIPRPHSYRAPSWSWASLKSPIIWLHPDHIVSTDLVALIDSSTTLASEDPFGQVTDGYVRLSGHLCLLQRHRYVATQHPDLGDWYDVEATGDVSKSPAGARFLIPFARAPAYSLPVSNTPERMYAGRIKGLVLEAIPGQAQNTFKRLGVFTHPCGEYRTEEERRDFPEFDGFDFDHSPRQVITIV
ncbi:heterokaryon incompatibility protein [Stemphylium lycopersici]|nr:heterokaryon incompatibility protein [Stemphylium lycopersici]